MVAPQQVSRWFLVAAAAFVVAAGARTVWIQGWQQRIYTGLAERNRIFRQVVRAPRGLILDRNGQALAANEPRYTQLYQANDQLRERILDTDEALSLMATAPAQVRTNFVRVYPFGPVTAHLVGYVQQPQQSGEVVTGRTGVERWQQAELAGQDGTILYERNALGEATRVLAQQPPQPGRPLSLTIDAQLSQVAFAALGSRRGAIIVGIPQTGEILAAISQPSFLPEANPSPDELAPWKEAVEEGRVAPSLSAALDFPNNPFLFRPLAATYPPGSIFKIVTALAGLEYGAIDERTQVVDEGVLKVGEFEYANWYWRQFGRVEGSIAIVRALARSNDSFFYKVAEWVGPQRLADFARHFSLGARTQAVFPGEREGLVPDPNWKQRQFGERWFLGNTYHMGIGQGDVLATPLQLQVLMSTVASRGRKCEPKFLLEGAGSCSEVSLEDESLALLIRGLRQACSAGGTGYPFFEVPYEVMCKTGTAEFGQEDDQGHRPTHGWFTAAISRGERQDPETAEFSADLVITVLVESDEEQPFREGSRDAAPIARQIADWWYAR